MGGFGLPLLAYMTISLYKKASKENHKYETEGVLYFYDTCDESELSKYISDGWVTTFNQLKGLQNGVQRQDEEESRQKPNEEVTKKQRGRPKAK